MLLTDCEGHANAVFDRIVGHDEGPRVTLLFPYNFVPSLITGLISKSSTRKFGVDVTDIRQTKL